MLNKIFYLEWKYNEANLYLTNFEFRIKFIDVQNY